jgi:signal transduction histidine kinase
MAATGRCREALGATGGIRPACVNLGLSTREARRIVELAHTLPRDDVALVTTLGDALVDNSLEHGWSLHAVRCVLDEVAEAAGWEAESLSLQVHLHAARNPSLLALSPPLALEMQVRMLAALCPVEDVSVWAGGAEDPTCLCSTSATGPARRARLAASEVLDGRLPRVGPTHAVPVERWQRVQAALVFSASAGNEPGALAAARETATVLTPILEREALLDRNASRERALVASGERLLTRIGFDLHDGPIQDVAALAGDIRMLRRRVEEHSEPIPDGVLFGFLEDLQARISAIDKGLRDVVHSIESPMVARAPLGDALRREVESARLQSDIAVELSLKGSFDPLTDSQRIALVRIVQESLSNARDHSGARSVSVSVDARSDGTSLEITDDGRGFDVPRTLVRAARHGRFGLLGMSERVRLLGGAFDVRSRPGGPTTISAQLPVWRVVEPPAAAALVDEVEAPLV